MPTRRDPDKARGPAVAAVGLGWGKEDREKERKRDSGDPIMRGADNLVKIGKEIIGNEYRMTAEAYRKRAEEKRVREAALARIEAGGAAKAAREEEARQRAVQKQEEEKRRQEAARRRPSGGGAGRRRDDEGERRR